MAAQEVTLKFRGDPSLLKGALNDLRTSHAAFTAEITRQQKAEAQAAIALQRQRSSALITVWKADTRAAENEEKARARAAESLQRQRSAALIAAWKAEQREHLRIARETEREAQRIAQESAQRRSAFISGAVGGFAALFGVSAVSEIRSAAAAMINYASTLETTTIAFTTMLGSAQAATAHLKELQAFALKTPFQFDELIAASQKMQALGFNASQVIPILTDVGNAVAAAGGGSERLDRVVLALSQIQSKGHVATQELNQLAESGISGWKMLEAQLGKSRAELVKMVEAGEISSKVFLDAFQKFSQQNFGGLMEQQSKTFSGAMSNIKDALLQTSAVAFAPLYKRLSELAVQFSDASQKSDDFKKKMESLGTVLATIPDAFIEIVHIAKDAFALALAAIMQQVQIATHLFLFLTRSIRAAVEALEALVKLAAGDFFGAMQAMNRSNQQAALGYEELAKAGYAAGGVVREVARIYEDAARRTANAAAVIAQAVAGVNTQANPDNYSGGEIGIGAGILRKGSSGSGVSTGGRGGGGGPTRSAGQSEAEREEKQRLDVYQQLQEELKKLQAELKGVDTSTRSYAIEQNMLNGVLSRGTPEIQEMNRASAKSVDNFRIQLRLQKELGAFWKQQRDDIAALTATEKGHIDTAAAFIVALEKQGAVLKEQTKFWLLFNGSILQANSALEKAIQLEDQLRAAGSVPLAGGVAEPGAVSPDVGLPPEGQDIVNANVSAIYQLRQAIDDNLSGDALAGATAGLDAMVEVFGQLGQAIGQVVESFVLYGNAGTSVRKVTAQILAGVAQQAAVKAVFELAEGFAALALAFFGLPNAGPSAQAHFTAAAIYGGIAGIAAVSGRAVAGNSFQQATNTSTGSGRQSGASSGGSAKPNTVEADRNQGFRGSSLPPITIVMHGEAGEAFNYKVVEAVVSDHRLNGKVRTLTEGGSV